uniref:Uncharacterized protein n=1 Tax=Rhizophora mucronata TaxID=61149 RepID=A0A2P2PG96_RHIMU
MLFLTFGTWDVSSCSIFSFSTFYVSNRTSLLGI